MAISKGDRLCLCFVCDRLSTHNPAIPLSVRKTAPTAKDALNVIYPM
ncbi:hypothetical protein [Coleofasciculus sp. E2-BRE-01]